MIDESWLVGENTTNNYLSVCKRAVEDDEFFETFKKQPAYQEILEHVSPQMGREYFSIIKERCDHFLKKFDVFAKNDVFGGADIHHFDSYQMSPSTMRYIKIAGDIESIFGDWSGFNVAEIGAGYGGQSLIMNLIKPFKSYTVYDLDDVGPLVKKYLGKHDIEARLGDLDDGSDYDLCISNFAFSECSKATQDLYIEKVIKRSKRGYMIINAFSDGLDRKNSDIIDVLSSVHKLDVRPDRPSYHDTKLILWGV